MTTLPDRKPIVWYMSLSKPNHYDLYIIETSFAFSRFEAQDQHYLTTAVVELRGVAKIERSLVERWLVARKIHSRWFGTCP
jgi:hypothetical protein